MTRTRYTINNRGREWYVEDADVAQYWKQKGAEVKAQTMSGPDVTGIPMQRLTETQLNDIEELAEAMDWDEVGYMVTDEQQQRVEA